MRRYGHDGPRAVFHQYEIADPKRDLLLAIRIDRVVLGEEAFLFEVFRILRRPPADHLIGLLTQTELIDQRVFRRQNRARRAIDRVDTRRENANLRPVVLETKVNLRALGAPDPVALHRHHALGPAAFEFF